MVIQDYSEDLRCAPPVATTFVNSTFGLDLNPDFGQGHDPRKSPIPGAGEEFLFQIDVASQFTQGGVSVPVFQIHAALSNVGAGVSIHTGTKVVVIGTVAPSTYVLTGPPVQSPLTAVGLSIDMLQQDATYFLRVNPWTQVMGRDQTGAAVAGKDLRYLGILITQTNFHIADCFATPASAIRARLVHESDIQYPADFMYPPGAKIVG